LATKVTVKKNKHVQVPEGPERAFGEALREVRTECGISQEKLALESGLDRTYVSLIERGAQSPTIRTLIKLARVLSVKPSEILSRMEANGVRTAKVKASGKKA
jgi:transcriptional regulator with XRE-family HTH domain